MVLVNITRQVGKSCSATFGPCCMRVRSPTPTRSISSQDMIPCISIFVLFFFGVASSVAGGGIGASQQELLRWRKSVTLAGPCPGLALYETCCSARDSGLIYYRFNSV